MKAGDCELVRSLLKLSLERNTSLIFTSNNVFVVVDVSAGVVVIVDVSVVVDISGAFIVIVDVSVVVDISGALL